MKIAEFFYSIQGEGILAGQPSVFIRLAGCNLRCRWCDTPYASWTPEGENMDIVDILTAVDRYPSRYAVVTGGEPMLAREIGALTDALRTRGYHITIETAATVYHPVSCDLASLSPKLSNSTPWDIEGGKYATRHNALRINTGVIQTFMDTYPYQLKFVLDTPDDIDEVEDLLSRLNDVHRERVLLMPQGMTPDELSEKSPWVAALCKTRGFRFSPRIHIDLYGHTRGT